MIVENLYSKQQFHCTSFSRLENDFYTFSLVFSAKDRFRFLKDLVKKGKYYRITHLYEEYRGNRVKVTKQVQLLRVIEHYTVDSTAADYFIEVGDELFICQELDNFGLVQMIQDLTKLDPKRKWCKLINGQTEKI